MEQTVISEVTDVTPEMSPMKQISPAKIGKVEVYYGGNFKLL